MESSVRYNETIGPVNNRKLPNDSDFGLDSGYASTSSSTYNITGANNVSSESPGVASQTHSSIPRKSIDLETIDEHYEVSFVPISPSVNETPTTRSIRQINAFHITTPQNAKNVLETTPTKSNYFYNTRSTHKGSHKKSRSSGSASRSPMHQKLTASQKKARGISMTFKEKLKSTDNLENEFLELIEETENNENDFSISMEDAAISPIGHHNRSTTTTPRSKQRGSLQRYPSGIESSTPKHGPTKRGNPQTVAKSHFMNTLAGEENTLYKRSRLIRKTQSFSPAKRTSSVLKEISTNWQAVLERHEEQTEEEEEQLVNPARKMLSFSTNQFDNLVNMKPNFQSHERKVTERSPKPSIGIKSQKLDKEQRLIVKAKSRLFKHPASIVLEPTPSLCIPKQVSSTVTSSSAGPSENVIDTSLESVMDSSITEKITPSGHSHCSIRGSNDSISDMDISFSTAPSTTPIKSESSVASTENYSIKSNIDLLLHSNIKSETPVGSKQCKQSIHDSVQRKPIKKLKRSISLNLPRSPMAVREFSAIIHPPLPCTPPKPYKKRKHPSSASRDETSDIRRTAEPTAKRKLYDICSRQSFYTRLEHLDILAHLYRFNTRPAINQILSNLSDKDLLSAYMVSKTWVKIIDEDFKASARRLQCLKSRRSSKENVPQSSTSIVVDITNIKREPFSRRNLNDNPVCKKQAEGSPPVSPSKRKFHENQKIVKQLKPGQNLTKCPRCGTCSIIDTASPLKPKMPAADTASRRKQLLATKKAYESCPVLRTEQQSFDSLLRESKWKSFDDSHISVEFAECTRSSCSFKFCTKCLCAYHPNAPCPVKPLGSSPTSDDDNQTRVTDVRSSKRNLRRLLLK